jgi:hypothetical protein
MFSVLEIEPKDREFEPGRRLWIFKGDTNQQHSFLRRGNNAGGSDVRWKIFRFLKSSLNISFFNLFLVALGLRGCYTY